MTADSLAGDHRRSISWTGWVARGWIHLIIGIVAIAVGIGVFTGATWARICGDPASGRTPIILRGLAIALARVVLLAAAPRAAFPPRSLLAPELTGSQWLVAVWLALPLVIGGGSWYFGSSPATSR
jgi:hypothetical protein